jgi:hypothetical protein
MDAERVPRRLLTLGLAFATGLSATTAASAPRPAPGAALRFMEGECDQLTLAGARGCRPVLVNLVYASGAVSFVFAGKDGRLLSFRTQVDGTEGDETRLKVNQVTVVGRGGAKVSTYGAAGNCMLTPFATDRSRVDCTARAGGTSFDAVFRTSDRKPKLLTLAGG